MSGTECGMLEKKQEGRFFMYIGNHLSSAKGYEAMGKQAVRLGGETFAFFTRNPRGGKAKEIKPEDVEKFLEIAKEQHFGKIVAHAPYTMNACAAKEDIRELAHTMFTDDLKRMEYTPGNYYNFHPGSHVGQGTETGITLIAELLNQVLYPEQTTTVLLETMAGKGSEVGRNFEELQAKIGVCLDTCHVWDAGYDIVEHLDEVLKEFDRIIGLERLKAIHLNDSMNPLGSHKDRHARLGEGQIGSEALQRIVCHEKLQGLPFILETPNDDEGYAAEIAIVKSWREGLK